MRRGGAILVLVVVASCDIGCTPPVDLSCDPEGSGCESMEIEPTTPTPAVDAEGKVLDGMVLISGGSFEMGIDEADLATLVEMGREVPNMSDLLAMWWFGDEIPRHTVQVDSFHMDTHEVTNRQFSLRALPSRQADVS